MERDSTVGLFRHEVKDELGGSSEDVFAFITDHHRLPRWAPGVRRVEVTAAGSPHGGVGTVRTLHPPLGPPGQEIVLVLEPPHHFGYSATDASLRGLCTGHVTAIHLERTERGCSLLWRVEARPGPGLWRSWLTSWLFKFAAERSVRNLRRHFPLQSLPSP